MILLTCTSPLSSLSPPRGERRFVEELLPFCKICWCSWENRLDFCCTSPFSGPSSTGRPNMFSASSGSLPIYLVKTKYEHYCLTVLFFTFFLAHSFPKWFLEGFAQAESPKALSEWAEEKAGAFVGRFRARAYHSCTKTLSWIIPLSLSSRGDPGML